MKSPYRRKISGACLFWACAVAVTAACAEPPAEKRIEIFIGGKQYDSLADYRQHQIDRLQEKAAPKPDLQAISFGDTMAQDIAEAVVRNVAGPVPQAMNRRMLARMIKVLREHQAGK